MPIYSVGPNNIVDFYPGNYKPGAETALRGTVDLINASWKLAANSLDAFDAKMNDALADWLDDRETPQVSAATVSPPTVTEPVVAIPETADVGDMMSTFDTKYLELVELLAQQFVTFRTTYFPDEQNVYTAAEGWLQAAMANESGLPANVVSAMVQEDEARVLADAARASEAVLATFAARGFPLPPGAAAAAVLQVQETAQKALSETSRKIILMSVEQLRWCVDRTLTLRQLSMSSAVEYIEALASGPDMASRLVDVGYDAQSKLISAAAQFYNARTNAQELVSKAQQFNVSTGLEAATRNQAAELQMIDAKLKALIAECQTLAQMATSLFNNLHTGANMNYNVNVS